MQQEKTLISGSKLGITIAAMAAALMAILDISIVNVALSDIRASFATPLDQIAWVSTGYMMANVVVIPITGWLQRRFGFRKYFTFSIIVFIIASALCGISWNLTSLVVFRILQGVGGGAIIPTAQSILFGRYPREQHGIAGALFGLGAVTGPLLGPTLGGYLIEIASWHWIFLINVPIGIFAAFMAYRFIEEPDFIPEDSRIDRYGIGLLAVGMGTLQYVLEEGNREGWFESTLILCLSVVAFVSLITFIVHELETENPVVDLRVFKNVSYSAATGINFMVGVALFSAGFLFSLYLGTIMRYTAFNIGVLFLQGSFIQIFLMPIIGKLGNRVDGRYLIGFGILGTALSLYFNTTLSNQSSHAQLVMPIFIRACAMGSIFVPLSVLALSNLPAKMRGNGAGLYNLTRELGGSIGTAFMSSTLSRAQTRNYSYFAESISEFSQATQVRVASLMQVFGARTLDAKAASHLILQNTLNQQSLIKSFNYAFWIVTIMFVFTFLLVFFIDKPKKGEVINDAH